MFHVKHSPGEFPQWLSGGLFSERKDMNIKYKILLDNMERIDIIIYDIEEKNEDEIVERNIDKIFHVFKNTVKHIEIKRDKRGHGVYE